MRSLYSDHGMSLSDPRKILTTFQHQLLRVGIFSLTSVADNPPMWAHYAGNHCGLAIGFSVEEGNKLGDRRHTVQVTYSDTKPTFDSGFISEMQMSYEGFGKAVSENKISFDDPVFRSAISTKPCAWSYENEWRYIEESSGARDFPGDLKSLIFGYRMSKEWRLFYKDLAKDCGLDVEIYEANISPDGRSEICQL